MKKLLVYLLLLAPLLGSGQLVTKPGAYVSERKTTTLSIAQDAQQVVAKFSHTGKDGRITTKEIRFSAGPPWAGLIEDELTFWLYKGGDSVLVMTVIPKDGEPLQVSTSTGIIDLRSDPSAVPQALLDFIATNRVPPGSTSTLSK